MTLPSVFLVGPLGRFEGGDESRDRKDTVKFTMQFSITNNIVINYPQNLKIVRFGGSHL